MLNTIVNIAMGFLVALVAGWRSFDSDVAGTRPGLASTLLVVVLGGVLLLPSALPLIFDSARRVDADGI